MALTAKEVAKLIGVSQATLSLVINNKPGISAKTRQKVLHELKERGLEYMLNQSTVHAEESGSKTPYISEEKPYSKENEFREEVQEVRQNRTIGFVTFRVGGELLEYHSFQPLIMEHLEIRARKYGYNLVYITINRNDMRASIQNIKVAGCSGFVIFATEMKEQDVYLFEELHIPFVLLDNHFNLHPLNSIKVNNEQGTYLAVDYLWKKGHRKIGYLRSKADISSFEERCQSALKAMKDYGCETPEEYVFNIRYSLEEASADMKELLSQNPKMPTAFMADNDVVAVGAMIACKEMGYHIPEEISFIGFDDRPMCMMIEPKLTSIRLPREYFGAEAIEILVRMLNGEENILEKIEINTSLVERESVSER